MGSVVVVGGGVAGLSCAWRLRRAGHEVEVLEREPEAGGRMRSERCGEFRLDRGAQFVTSGYRNLHALADALGLGPRVRRLDSAREAVLRDGRFYRADPWAGLLSGLLSARARARLPRLALELLRQARHLDPWHPERAARLDAADLVAGLRAVVGDEVVERWLAPAFAATFDSEPEQLSYAFGLLMLRFLAGGFQLQSFDAGAGLLTRALAAEVSVRTGCRVHSVETATDGARLRYRTQGRERSVLADAAVVALPGCEVVQVCPKLTPQERGFFERVHYVRGIIAHLLLPRPPVGLHYSGVCFPRALGLGLYGIAADHHKPGAAPAGAGLVNAALSEAACARLWQASDAAVEAQVLADLARTPLGRLQPQRCVVHRWEAMLPRFRPGYLRDLARFHGRMERSPRLAFAGDYLVGPHAEGAVTSGMRAATEIARAL